MYEWVMNEWLHDSLPDTNICGNETQKSQFVCFLFAFVCFGLFWFSILTIVGLLYNENARSGHVTQNEIEISPGLSSYLCLSDSGNEERHNVYIISGGFLKKPWLYKYRCLDGSGNAERKSDSTGHFTQPQLTWMHRQVLTPPTSAGMDTFAPINGEPVL